MDDPEINGDAVDSEAEAPEKPRYIGVIELLILIAVSLFLIEMPSARLRVTKLLAAYAILLPIHLLPFYILGRCAHITVEQVAFFMGGALLRWRQGQTWFSVGWWPIGGFVRFKGMRSDVATPAVGTWPSAARFTRVFNCLSGPLALCIFSLIVLGSFAFEENLRQTPQQVRDFLADSKRSTKQFLHFVDSAPMPALLGACGVKLMIANTLPLPLLNGGQAIIELFNLRKHRRALGYLELLSLLLILASFIYLVYSAARALRA
jgi:hypothetical protein